MPWDLSALTRIRRIRPSSPDIPHVGLMVRSMSSRALRVGCDWIPFVPGYLTYHETTAGTIRTETNGNLRNSYFLEAFAEYGRDLMGGSIGVFGTVVSTWVLD